MSIVTSPSADWVQGSSYIGYDSFFLQTGVVVVASKEDVGFTALNGVSWPVYSGGWQATAVDTSDITLAVTLPAAATGNSYAVHKHNLFDLGASVKLQYSSDGVAWTDLTGSSVTPGNNRTIFFVGTEISQKFWRIVISGLVASDVLKIGHAFIGNSLRLFSGPETGFSPPNIALQNEFISSRSDGGDFLGRSLVRKGSEGMFTITSVLASWVRANWIPFMEAAEKHPFYHAWDTSTFPAEVGYCYVEKVIDTPRYTSQLHMTVTLKYKVLQE
jgi:hypothetical protein